MEATQCSALGWAILLEMPSKLRCAASLALALSACSNTDSVRPPNLLLISIDSLRYDHVGCYGYPAPTTPTLDRLAREGVRFQNAVSTTSWTLPSHAAMFTGLYDSTHGLVDNGLRLDPRHRTLAEELARAGYHTAGFFGGPYLHPLFGLGDGFEVYESCMEDADEQLDPQTFAAQSRRVHNASHADITSPRTLERVLKWSASAPVDKPFFLFVHLWDVHYDYHAPAEYVELFDQGYSGALTGVDFVGNAAIKPGMDPRDFKRLMALYDAEIRFTDDHIGRMLDGLKAAGRLDNTLVIVTADHGEEFLEHGKKGHQRTLFEEVVRVPMIAHWPGQISANGVAHTQVRLIDLMPTFLAVAGVRDVPLMSGRDLRPLLAGRALEERPALLELHADGRQFAALRTNELKVLSQGKTPRGDSLPDYAFDLARDPREQQPLDLNADARATKGFAALREVRKYVVELRERIGASAEAVDLDEQMQRRLRELGYLGADASDEQR